MKKIASILILFVLCILIVSACAPQRSTQSGPATPAVKPDSTVTSSVATVEMTPLPPTGTPGETAAAGQKIVTLDDQGQTINLMVGESFLLNLGDAYAWEVNISDQNVLSRAKNITVVRGAQGVYDANQAGTVTLSASGDPLCRQSQPPCALPSVLFMITVVVN